MTLVPNRQAETLRAVQESAAVDLHTALPGIIVRYNHQTQTADIQPAVQRVIPALDEDEEDSVESLPVLPNVPVAFPRAGGFFLHFPLAVGDSVLVVFCEQDTNAWRNTGDEADPGSPERHGLSGAVAIPGYFPRTSTIADADDVNGHIGRDGGPNIEFQSSQIHAGGSSPLANGTNTDAHLAAIEASLTTIAAAAGSSNSYIKSALDGTNPIPTTILKGS